MERTIDYQIEVMQAFKEGKKIEWCDKDNNIWEDIEEPKWDWISSDYRIKEEPVYVPFETTEELIEAWQKKTHSIPANLKGLIMPLIWIKKDEFKQLIIQYSNTNVYFTSLINDSTTICSLNDLLRYYTFLDGSPIGKLASV